MLTLFAGVTVNAQICENLLIYPNPVTSNTLYVKTSTDSVLITKVEIFDMWGRKVLNRDYNECSISLMVDDSFKAGVYIIRVNEECTRKIIIKTYKR